jgi:hypothetical protein
VYEHLGDVVAAHLVGEDLDDVTGRRRIVIGDLERNGQRRSHGWD